MIEAINLNKYYGSYHAVRDVSFFVEEGKTVGFLGGNGAGKSTTMRMLTGFIKPSSGIARIAGIDVNANPLEARKNLAYLPESTPLYTDMRVREYLEYRARLKGISVHERMLAIDKTLEDCWLTDVQNRIIGHLSKGYRQRVGLADCLLGDPKILILDEPTVGLDPNQVRQTRELIKKIGEERTVFLSTHILHEVELSCEEVIIIKDGAIAARDTTRNLCNSYTGERHLNLQLNTQEHPHEYLSRVQHVTQVEKTSSNGWRLTCLTDPRRELSRLAADRGWLVEEMTLEPVRLEEIFSKLTLATTDGN